LGCGASLLELSAQAFSPVGTSGEREVGNNSGETTTALQANRCRIGAREIARGQH